MTERSETGISAAMLIYKILRREEWRALVASGETAGAPVDLADGFVHFSTGAQLAETAARHFAGEAGLTVVAVEAEGLDGLRWEPSRGGALFPHLYRPLRLADIAWHTPIERVSRLLEAHVDPERAQFVAFKALPRETPVEMLNLVRFRDRAAYPPDFAGTRDLSGAEAYARYGAESGPVFRRVGGSIVWRGSFEALLIDPAEERWDAAFVARYPSAGAFLEMVTDPVYRAAVVHRQAAVATSRLVRFAPADPGGAFG